MKEYAQTERIEAALREHGLTGTFPEPLYSHMTLCRYEVGDLICSQGERASSLFLLVSGRIKVYTTSEEGNVLVLSLIEPLELIGDVEYIRGIPIMNTVMAVTPVEMLRVPYGPLTEHGRDYAPLLRFFLTIIMEKFQRKSSFLSFNLLHSVEERLAGYLLSVTSDRKGERSGGRVDIPSLRDAANQIGTSYRHLNRVLKKLVTDGHVRREKGFLEILDRGALRKLAGEEFE
ncbi:Crp/Fnr family transcriptional regulator [Gorillibacterium sp. sgz500922]|uniref:Crp/Fnr family transcriptional regulator n=1 Tax=Gorillibacterium sp. sgz500922 TaxID=3446694 RepID=UPI003F66528E